MTQKHEPRTRRTLLCVALALLGCSPAPVDEPVARRQSSMVGGDLSPSGSEDDAVLLLRATADGEVICTATLVAPNLALTTRHCVAFNGPPPFQCTPEGELVPNSSGGGQLGADYPVDSIELHAADLPRDEPVAGVTQVISTVTTTICKNDIAFLVLDRNVDLQPRPIRTSIVTEAGEPVVLVGYGATATGQALDYQQQERRRRDDLAVFDVGPDSVEDGVKGTPPRTLRFQGPASCMGDSGGPAFSKQSGAVIGVFSLLASADCSAPKVSLLYTHTAPFETLVEQAFDAAGASLIPEPAPSLPDAGAADAAEQDDAGAPASEPPARGGCAITALPADPDPFWLAIALAAVWRGRSRYTTRRRS